MDEKSERVAKNLIILNDIDCDFVILPMSENMLSHSIVDASSSLRQILNEGHLHNYAIQEFGPENKIQIPTVYLAYKLLESGFSTLYRATKRGDCRIWFGPFTRKYASPGDNLAIFAYDKIIYLLNLSLYDIKRALNSDFENPIKSFFNVFHSGK